MLYLIKTTCVSLFCMQVLHGFQKKNVEKRNFFYIQQNKERCYNGIYENPPIINRPFIYKGIRYESTRDAIRKGAGVGRAHLKRLLIDPNNPEAYYLDDETQPYGQIPIFAKKGDGPSVLFNSFKECVDAGYATNGQNARRKIQCGEVGWRYAHVDSEGKPIRKPYTLKEGEISYQILQNQTGGTN